MLTPVARRRGLVALIIDTFLMWGGFFMVIPLIAVHYVDGLGWSAAAVGLVLAVRQVLQQGLTLFGGMLADRFGARGLICAGLLIRAVAFAAIAWADTYPLLMVAGVLAALGGALFEAPRAAAIAALSEEAERARLYSIMGIASGLGMTLGPLAGALLLRVDFALVAYAAAACFLLTLIVTMVLLPPVRVASGEGRLLDGIGMALRDRRFVLFNLLLMGYWFMWVQLTISLPLEASAIAGTADAVSWVYVLNAGMSVVLQYPMLWLAERWMRPLAILTLGVTLMAIGLAGVALAEGVVGLLLCVALFSVGALLATPTQQTVTAELANPAALGSYFGVSALALAFGGGFGNYAGGAVYSLGRSMQLPELPWLMFAAIGMLAASGLALLDTRTSAKSVSTEGVRG